MPTTKAFYICPPVQVHRWRAAQRAAAAPRLLLRLSCQGGPGLAGSMAGWLRFGGLLFAFRSRNLLQSADLTPHLLLPLLPLLQALQAGLAELRGWVAYVGGEWCCGAEEAESAIERTTQAARYLVQVRWWGSTMERQSSSQFLLNLATPQTPACPPCPACLPSSPTAVNASSLPSIPCHIVLTPACLPACLPARDCRARRTVCARRTAGLMWWMTCIAHAQRSACSRWVQADGPGRAHWHQLHLVSAQPHLRARKSCCVAGAGADCLPATWCCRCTS